MLISHSTKSGKTLATIALLFFVVYCAVGVCTNWVGSATGSTSESAPVIDHSLHHSGGEQIPGASHCGGDENGCEWSRQLVADPMQDVDPDHSFFVLYLLSAGALLALLWRQVRQFGPYVRQLFELRGYPRLHLQHAVFLN